MKPALSLTALFIFSMLALPVAAQNMTTSEHNASTIKQMEMRLSAVEAQMRQLTGLVEKFNHSLSHLQTSVERLQSDTDARLQTLEKAPKTKTPQPQTTPLPQIKKSTKKAPAEKLSVDEQYNRAFAFLRQTDYNEAERSFKLFIQQHPKDKLAENAKYWYAETFYVRGRFGDAAIAFADAFEHNPKGSKAPDSLLKLAMSLAAIDKVDDACNTLAALDAKYPKAPMTIRTRSKQERMRLKCK